MSKLRPTLSNIVTLSDKLKEFKFKQKSIEDMIASSGLDRDTCEKVKNSKQGWLSMRKISNNNGYLQQGESEMGWCSVFGVGFSARVDDVDRFYYTSNIVDIDWDKMEFKTNNSTYSFSFEDYSLEELINFIEHAEFDGKYQEIN